MNKASIYICKLHTVASYLILDGYVSINYIWRSTRSCCGNLTLDGAPTILLLVAVLKSIMASDAHVLWYPSTCLVQHWSTKRVHGHYCLVRVS